MQKFFVNVIFLYCKFNPNNILRHCIESSLVVLWNFLSFPVLQVVTSLEPPALSFNKLALFSIYGNDGDIISTGGAIINIEKYHWEKVQEVNPL